MASDSRGLCPCVPRARRPGARRSALMQLVFVTQTLDPEHGSLAQTLDLVGALAPRVEELHVLAREDRWGEAPDNVTVRTFGAHGKIGRGASFERELAGALPGTDGVLVHMVPTFAVLAAPQ